MNFDKIKGSSDAQVFNENFDFQINEFNAKHDNEKKKSQFSILQQKRGFAEDQFDLFEPQQVTQDVTQKDIVDSRNHIKKRKSNTN